MENHLKTAKHLQDQTEYVNDRMQNTEHLPHEAELNRKLAYWLAKQYQKLVFEILKHK